MRYKKVVYSDYMIEGVYLFYENKAGRVILIM